MSSLSKISSKCSGCIFLETCTNKKKEALAYLTTANAASMISSGAIKPEIKISIDNIPVTMTVRDIHIVSDKIEKKIYERLGLGKLNI